MTTYHELTSEKSLKHFIEEIPDSPYHQLKRHTQLEYLHVLKNICTHMQYLGLGNAEIDFKIYESKQLEELEQLSLSLENINYFISNSHYQNKLLESAETFSKAFELIKIGLRQNANAHKVYEVLFKHIMLNKGQHFESFVTEIINYNNRNFRSLREGETSQNLNKCLLRYYIYQLAFDEKNQFSQQQQDQILNDHTSWPQWLLNEINAWHIEGTTLKYDEKLEISMANTLSRMLFTGTFQEKGTLSEFDEVDCKSVQAYCDELDKSQQRLLKHLGMFEKPKSMKVTPNKRKATALKDNQFPARTA